MDFVFDIISGGGLGFFEVDSVVSELLGSLYVDCSDLFCVVCVWVCFCVIIDFDL